MPKEGGRVLCECCRSVVERERVFCFKFIALGGLLLSWDMHATNIIK